MARQASPSANAGALTLVVFDETAPQRPAETTWDRLAEQGGGGAVLVVALAERRLELAADAAWVGAGTLAELRAELRERVAPLLAAGAVEPALALAERLLREASGA